MKKYIFLLLLFPLGLFSQQIVRGKVVDQESQFPLPGVNIKIITSEGINGVATDNKGIFKLEKVLRTYEN